jgi:hypothetical protein
MTCLSIPTMAVIMLLFMWGCTITKKNTAILLGSLILFSAAFIQLGLKNHQVGDVLYKGMIPLIIQ